MNKRNLIILIQTEKNIVFGGFISQQINRLEGWISDDKAFLFSFKEKSQIKIDIPIFQKRGGRATGAKNSLKRIL